MEAWYFTPLPKEYHVKCLYFCDFCLFFCVNKTELKRHSRKCTVRNPPGNEIYRDKDIAFFEINGCFEKIYCENLSFLSRMFLDHKNLDYTIECFFYYVLCEVKDDGFHFAGYFSKDRARLENQTNNLSCILVLPKFQKSGFGKLLIEMSYALSVIEEKPGSPERPLSDLGHKIYVQFWTRRVVKTLIELEEDLESISVVSIIKKTGMLESDINYILNHHQI